MIRMSETRFPADAVILAAGLGTRLRPLTQTVAKPLVKVGGVPLIERAIRAGMAEGVGRFVVNAHYLADQVADEVSRLARDLPDASFALSLEKDLLLGTGGGVARALRQTRGDSVLVLNADSFWLPQSDRPLARLMNAFVESDALAALLCVDPSRSSGLKRSHDFCLDPRRRLTADRGAPVLFAGAALYARALFADAPEGAFAIQELWAQAEQQGRMIGARLDADWFHVGDLEGLRAAEARLGAAE